MKDRIQAKIHQDLRMEKESKTKLRWINPGKRQQYAEECTIAEVSSFLKIRLHMMKLMANYGGGQCRRCGLEAESTEHVLECQTNGMEKYKEERSEDILWLRKIKTIYEQFEEQFTI